MIRYLKTVCFGHKIEFLKKCRNVIFCQKRDFFHLSSCPFPPKYRAEIQFQIQALVHVQQGFEICIG